MSEQTQSPLIMRLKLSNPYFTNLYTRIDEQPEEVQSVMKEAAGGYTKIGAAVAALFFKDIVAEGWVNENAHRHAARATGRTMAAYFSFELPEEKEKPVKPVAVKEPKKPKEKPAPVTVTASTEPASPPTVQEQISDSVQGVVDSVKEAVETAISEVFDPTPLIASDPEPVVSGDAQAAFDKDATGQVGKSNINTERFDDDGYTMTYRGTRADGSKVPYRKKYDDGTIEFVNAAGLLHDPYKGRAAVTHPDGTKEHYTHGVRTCSPKIDTGSITTRDREV